MMDILLDLLSILSKNKENYIFLAFFHYFSCIYQKFVVPLQRISKRTPKNRSLTNQKIKIMETKINFKQTMYKLDAEHMIVFTKQLEDLVCESAEETTTPKGVGPKLHIEERDGKYQLRMWGPRGQGNTLVEEYETEEEAQAEWMNRTYEDDFVNSDEYGKWFNTEDEAIEDYLNYAHVEIDETLTADKVREQIAAKRDEIEDYKKATGSRLNRQMKEQYDICKKNGAVTKNARKLASRILYDGIRYDGIFEMYIRYREIVSAETIALAKEINDTPKA